MARPSDGPHCALPACRFGRGGCRPASLWRVAAACSGGSSANDTHAHLSTQLDGIVCRGAGEAHRVQWCLCVFASSGQRLPLPAPRALFRHPPPPLLSRNPPVACSLGHVRVRIPSTSQERGLSGVKLQPPSSFVVPSRSDAQECTSSRSRRNCTPAPDPRLQTQAARRTRTRAPSRFSRP
jgi:hypothetical protein